MQFNRHIRLVKRNIRRSPYQALTATMVMFFTFFVLSVFVLVAVGSQLVLKYYENVPQVMAFFKDEATTSDIQAIENSLKQTGKVTSMNFVSKQDALKRFQNLTKAHPEEQELVTANILPASLEISADNLDDLKPISEVLKKEPVISDVLYPDDVVQKVRTFTNIVRIAGAALTGFLIIFSLMIILIVTGFKIRIRRTEIETMKLLGASMWFIRLPFILEGITYGLIGAVFAWVLSYLVLWYVSPPLETSLGPIHILPASPLFMLSVLGIEIVVAIIIGATGSFAAVRRYLKI